MERSIFMLIAIALSLFPASALANQSSKEVTIFDSDGEAVAYIAVADEMTIYLWSGDPVAYIETGNDDLSIYGFNGKHLGWIEDGIIIDHEGYGVGFLKGALNVATKPEPFKGFKKFKPFKAFQEFEPFKPLSKPEWSKIPLAIFLGRGVKS